MTIRVVTESAFENLLKVSTGHNFIALNLMTLAHFEDFNHHKNVYWVDGMLGRFYIFLKTGRWLKKQPGVHFLRNLLSLDLVKHVSILGSSQHRFWEICKLNNIEIVSHDSLEAFDLARCGEVDLNVLSNYVIISLPAPKQELLAHYVSDRRSQTNIFCIGGALQMLVEKNLDCPNWLRRAGCEWLWRLRSDTKRRLFRLFGCLFLVLGNLYTLSTENIVIIDQEVNVK